MLNGRWFASRALMGGVSALAIFASPAAADEYQYDSLGRLVRVTYDSGAVVQYTYDLAGNRTQVVVNTGVSNGAPVAVNDTANVNVSAFVDIWVVGNDTDPDSHALTVTAVGTPAGGGTVAIQGSGTVRYTAPATAGAKSFSYTISDGHGGTASATVNVTVIAPNQAPVAVNDTGVEIERYTTGYIYPLDNDSDPDGHSLTITSVSGTGASVGPGGGYIVYAAGGLGIKTLTYTISDGHGGTATASIQVLVYRP